MLKLLLILNKIPLHILLLQNRRPKTRVHVHASASAYADPRRIPP
uniref:Uncharacterized protein n=1 Tax=Rhizophora mucronata TaxID=61149 RepID=A0A2P2MAQ1_RHIMU